MAVLMLLTLVNRAAWGTALQIPAASGVLGLLLTLTAQSCVCPVGSGHAILVVVAFLLEDSFPEQVAFMNLVQLCWELWSQSEE